MAAWYLKGVTTPAEVSKFAQAETLLGDNIDVE